MGLVWSVPILGDSLLGILYSRMDYGVLRRNVSARGLRPGHYVLLGYDGGRCRVKIAHVQLWGITTG